jgi:flagellar biosynthesis protein FlhB
LFVALVVVVVVVVAVVVVVVEVVVLLVVVVVVPLGRPRRRWEDNIKMDLQEVGWGHGLDRYGSG